MLEFLCMKLNICTFDSESDSKCPEQLMVEGFAFDDSGLYIKQNNSGSIEDSSKGRKLERDYYRHEKLQHRCIWWHKLYRHWWIGRCNSLGENQGHAYLVPDTLCPHQGKPGEWHRGGIDTPLESGIVREAKPNDLKEKDKGSNPVKVKKILGLKCLLFLSWMVF